MKGSLGLMVCLCLLVGGGCREDGDDVKSVPGPDLSSPEPLDGGIDGIPMDAREGPELMVVDGPGGPDRAEVDILKKPIAKRWYGKGKG